MLKNQSAQREEKYVAYYRVSTQRQGQSGLGLEAQKHTVNFFCEGGEILAEFTEVESGKQNKRPELEKALRYAKENKATLVVAKLDRLSRNVSFIFALRDSGVDFRACDIRELNTLTIGILATMAQHERELISQRTKEALAAKKARGEKLGNPQNLIKAKAWKKSLEVRRAKAGAKYHSSEARIKALELKMQNLTLRAIAQKLNEAGYKTPKGCDFQAVSVLRILK